MLFSDWQDRDATLGSESNRCWTDRHPSSLIDLILKLRRDKSFSDSYDHGYTDRRLSTQPEGEQFLVGIMPNT